MQKLAAFSGVRTRRIALVTGASRGIGAAVAHALAATGLHVVLAARSTERLREVASHIIASGGEATMHEVDLSQAVAIDTLARMVERTWGHLDILIANAAVLGPLSSLSEVTDEAWRETIETNLTANWRLLRGFDPLLRRSEAGRVVILTSSAASNLKPGRGTYAISKAAVEVLAKTYALETATTAIRVNLVDPGAVNTDMRALAVQGEDHSLLPRPEHVAQLIVELAAHNSDVTGQIIRFPEWRTLRAQSATR